MMPLLCLLVLLLSLAVEVCNCKEFTRLSHKRILSEWKDISKDGLSLDQPFSSLPTECGVRLSPLRSNLLEWHFSFTGLEGSAFEGGVYHGIIKLHPDYPQKAPAICVCTPSGRWIPNVDICLSASAHHQEAWDPNWNLRTLVLSLRGFMTTQAKEIGGMTSAKERHVELAYASRGYLCKSCGINHARLLGLKTDDNTQRGRFLQANDDIRVSKPSTAARSKGSAKSVAVKRTSTWRSAMGQASTLLGIMLILKTVLQYFMFNT